MTARKRRGRPPSVWHEEIGYKFVEAVAHTIYRHPRPMTTGHAIRMVLKQPEFAPLRKYAKNGSKGLGEERLGESKKEENQGFTHATLLSGNSRKEGEEESQKASEHCSASNSQSSLPVTPRPPGSARPLSPWARCGGEYAARIHFETLQYI